MSQMSQMSLSPNRDKNRIESSVFQSSAWWPVSSCSEELSPSDLITIKFASTLRGRVVGACPLIFIDPSTRELERSLGPVHRFILFILITENLAISGCVAALKSFHDLVISARIIFILSVGSSAVWVERSRAPIRSLFFYLFYV
jgi:hypothetical protein